MWCIHLPIIGIIGIIFSPASGKNGATSFGYWDTPLSVWTRSRTRDVYQLLKQIHISLLGTSDMEWNQLDQAIENLRSNDFYHDVE